MKTKPKTNSIRNLLRIQIVSFALIGLLVCCCRYPPTADCVLVCVIVCSPQVSTLMQLLLLLVPAQKPFGYISRFCQYFHWKSKQTCLK